MTHLDLFTKEGDLFMLLDPMEIIRDRVRGDFAGTDSGTYGFFLDLTSLYGMIRDNVLILSSTAVLVGFISMLFVNQSKMKAEKKADVQYRLFIIVLIVAAPTLFGWAKKLFDTLLM